MQGSDLIEVRGLKLRGRIGVTADERSQDQPLVMSIAARLDTRAASTTDDASPPGFAARSSTIQSSC